MSSMLTFNDFSENRMSYLVPSINVNMSQDVEQLLGSWMFYGIAL